MVEISLCFLLREQIRFTGQAPSAVWRCLHPGREARALGCAGNISKRSSEHRRGVHINGQGADSPKYLTASWGEPSKQLQSWLQASDCQSKCGEDPVLLLKRDFRENLEIAILLRLFDSVLFSWWKCSMWPQAVSLDISSLQFGLWVFSEMIVAIGSTGCFEHSNVNFWEERTQEAASPCLNQREL